MLTFYRNKTVFCLLSRVWLLWLTVFFCGCAHKPQTTPITELSQPPSEKILTHRVARGDTLYGISRRYGIPLADLLALNQLALFDTILPGQLINLDLRQRPQKKTQAPSTARVKVYRAPSSSVKPSANSPKKQVIVKAKPVKPITSSHTATASRPPKPTPPSVAAKKARPSSQKTVWQWPLKGRHAYQKNHLNGTGIDIRGTKGDSVLSAAAGEVVYAGEGLRAGHGQLVIVKHSERYLSAYAQIGRLQVKEHQRVKKGQVLASLAAQTAQKNGAALYFEIRDKGQAVDPIRLLPKS